MIASEVDPSVVTTFRRDARRQIDSSGVTVILCTYDRAQRVADFLRSLVTQHTLPRQLIIVDASPNDMTERIVNDFLISDSLDFAVTYFRVSAGVKGLTLQRNFGLRYVTTTLVVYFDDDVILHPECLEELVKAFAGDPTVVGAAGYNDAYRPSHRLWKLRKSLHMVASLRPGSYQRSGMSVPWSFMSSSETLVSDWLPGCGMMWKTSVLREVGGFNSDFSNYALGEDLDISLRAGRKGKLLVVGAAKFDHLLDKGGGRPNPYKQGYMEIYNRFLIQRRGLADRTWRDTLLFTYAWTLDTLMLLRHLGHPRGAMHFLRQIAGRAVAAIDLIRGK